MRYSRWTIIPPSLARPLAVSLSQRVPISAQLLQIGCCLSVKYLAAGRSCGQVVEQELWLKTAIHIFPCANKTDRSWFVKLDLWKMELSVKERGVWETSVHPFVLGKSVVGRRSRESRSDIPRGIFFSCCCPEDKPENAPDSVAAPSTGMQLFPLVSWVYSFPLACSPLYSHHVSALLPHQGQKIKKRENCYCLRDLLMAVSESRYWL